MLFMLDNLPEIDSKTLTRTPVYWILHAIIIGAVIATGNNHCVLTAGMPSVHSENAMRERFHCQHCLC